MSLVASGFPTRSNTNRAVQLKTLVEDVGWRLEMKRGCICSKTKGADQLIKRFSHDVAHLTVAKLSWGFCNS